MPLPPEKNGKYDSGVLIKHNNILPKRSAQRAFAVNAVAKHGDANLQNLLSASRVGFRISVVNSNAAHVGLSSPHPVFQLLEPVVTLTEAVTVI